MSTAENHKYWSKKLAEFKKSRKTKEEWCEKENITINQFNYWLRQFPGENTPTQWLPVEIQTETTTLPSPPLTIKIGAASIEIHPGFDKDHLSEVLKILTTLC
jgi:hypothetical protein